MNKAKLIQLFLKEKTRVENQVFSPIFKVLKDPKFDNYYKGLLILNVNNEILINKEDLLLIPYTTPEMYKSYSQMPGYDKYFQKIENQILEIFNFDVFKIVFNHQTFKPWALSFYKYMNYFYYTDVLKLSIPQTSFKTTVELSPFLINKTFKELSDAIYKTIYGISNTSIYSFKYWQSVTGISRKFYDHFYKIVADNNPVTELLNSFLYYNSYKKVEQLSGKTIHTFRTFTNTKPLPINDINKAKEWMINYFACITLNQKVNIGLWKAIQNLVFGTKSGSTVIVMRTISEINVNIRNMWKLDQESQKYFKAVKYQALFVENLPSTFFDFLNQEYSKVSAQIIPFLKTYNKILTKLGVKKNKE